MEWIVTCQQNFLLATVVLPWFVSLSPIAMGQSQTSSSHSVWDILEEEPEFALFRQGLESANLTSVLKSRDQAGSAQDDFGAQREWTIFAPSNQAFNDPDWLPLYFMYNINPLYWIENLREVLLNQFISIGSFTVEDLFDPEVAGSALRTASGNIVHIDLNRSEIGGLKIGSPRDLEADNGIVHAVDFFFERKGNYQDKTLLEIIQDNNGQAEDGFRLLGDLLNQTGLSSLPGLSQQFAQKNGTTFLAPRNNVLQNRNVDTSEINDLLKYHILENNLFEGMLDFAFKDLGGNLGRYQIPSGFFVATKHSTGAHMLVSRTPEGSIRFNGKGPDDRLLASNGVLYATNDLLEPPGMMELLGNGTMARAIHPDFIDFYDLFETAGWNVHNLATVLQREDGKGNSTGRYTILIPSGFYASDMERLQQPDWWLHLDDLLRHRVISRTYTRSELLALPPNYQISTLGGANHTVISDGYSGGSIRIGGASFPSENEILRGIDGEIWFMSSRSGLFYPPSFSSTLYERLENEWSSLFQSLRTYLTDFESPNINDVQTFLCPPYEDAKYHFDSLYSATSPQVLRNHLFEGVYYMETLLGMDGESISSVNGKVWTISVLNEEIFIQPEGAAEGNSVVMIQSAPESQNILARNGVIHYLDGVMIDEPFATKTEIESECQPEIDGFRICYESCNSDQQGYCSDQYGRNVYADTVLDQIIPALQLLDSVPGCTDLRSVVCGSKLDYIYRDDCCYKMCGREAHDVLTCYADNFDEAELSECTFTKCPTPRPTPQPTPRPSPEPASSPNSNSPVTFSPVTSTEVKGGVNSSSDENQIGTVYLVFLISMAVAIGLLAAYVVHSCCVKREKANENFWQDDLNEEKESENAMTLEFTNEKE